MINNKNNSNEFDLSQRINQPLRYKYKKVIDKKTTGTLNSYQKIHLTDVQKEKIKEDKRKLGED
jgi:hypothetical protein|tara:strand:+ start:13286 stop:13477 length:192 start_codon:yes stop_codon:yes gene_type:complete